MTNDQPQLEPHQMRPRARRDILLDYHRELVKSRKRQDSLEDRLELIERDRVIEKLLKHLNGLTERIERLEGTPNPNDSALGKEGDDIFEVHRQELEANHMGKVVAIDLKSRTIAGIGNDIDEAYENALNACPEQNQFHFRRVGKAYLQRW